jgi:hypothetical protein
MSTGWYIPIRIALPSAGGAGEGWYLYSRPPSRCNLGRYLEENHLENDSRKFNGWQLAKYYKLGQEPSRFPGGSTCFLMEYITNKENRDSF